MAQVVELLPIPGLKPQYCCPHPVLKLLALFNSVQSCGERFVESAIRQHLLMITSQTLLASM
jgi:hypothetical protein